VQSYGKGIVEESMLADWICHHLTLDQAAVIRDSSLQQKQRLQTTINVRRELQESLRDYNQATVSTNDRGKLLIPQLVQSYGKGIVEESMLADWICHHLTLDQAAVIRDSSSQQKQRLLGVHSFTILAFESKFQYLFLPDSSYSPKPEAK
jgi:hypothetical protein